MAYKQIDRFDWFMYFFSTERRIPHQKCFFCFDQTQKNSFDVMVDVSKINKSHQ